MHQLKFLFVLLAVGITVIDFATFGAEKNGIGALYLVPLLLALSFICSVLISRSYPWFSLLSIIMEYCVMSAGFVGVLLPLAQLIHHGIHDISMVPFMAAALFGIAALLTYAALVRHLTKPGK
uniref:hypothetical protein n=1 Tax=Microbulbifer agarilyticus TaxID=260552 RepID=UPI00025582F1|nr:hypothetical protein [Microbulbifer agarilyticus]